MVWPNVGQADGVNGDLVMIAPPFIISPPEIDSLVSLFKTALDETLRRTGGFKQPKGKVLDS